MTEKNEAAARLSDVSTEILTACIERISKESFRYALGLEAGDFEQLFELISSNSNFMPRLQMMTFAWGSCALGIFMHSYGLRHGLEDPKKAKKDPAINALAERIWNDITRSSGGLIERPESIDAELKQLADDISDIVADVVEGYFSYILDTIVAKQDVDAASMYLGFLNKETQAELEAMLAGRLLLEAAPTVEMIECVKRVFQAVECRSNVSVIKLDDNNEEEAQ
jgi:uncharacterized protein (UPF0335 family)